MKHKKRALFNSLVSLILCISMLVGTTFAWFTDGVTSGTNLIAAGVLDIEMEYLDADGNWQKVDENTEVLDKNALWEPGYTEVAYLKISNVGNLALKYALGIGVLSEIGSVNVMGDEFKLSDHILFGLIESETPVTYATRQEARDALTTSQAIRDGYSVEFALNSNGDERYVALVVYMPEEVGNIANYATGETPPEIQLGIELIATQTEYESDSFGTDYDAEAEMPAFSFPVKVFDDSTSSDVTTDGEDKVAQGITIQGSSTNAVIPAGVQLEAGTEKLTLEVTSMGESGANISLNENEAMRSLNVHVEGVSANNTVPMEIYIKEAAAKGLNAGNLKLYHVENGVTVEMTAVDTFTAHNQFKYDPATGDVTLYMATFSEVTVVANTANPWNGEFDYSWYTNAVAPLDGDSTTDYVIANADQLAGFGAIVGGMEEQTQNSFKNKTVKLISDVNLGGANNVDENGKRVIFYPIGYNSDDGKYEKTGVAVTTGFYTFEGTFDGQGHTISNIYQNTWEMKGDNEYYDATEQNYRDGMGLFGKVYGGTVKNLTVANFSSDGEFTTTGVIAAYADSSAEKSATFENIAIVGCNPRVYNIGNGGIVGCGGWYSKDTTTNNPIIFKNITVDKTNKISALWGSWDVACGGIMGQYYPNSGCGVKFENCNMSAQIDVYNDVCANYQYYAYRYAGMMIGSIRNNLPADENGHVYPDMTGITASNCTVNFGDWNDYYYCELVANSLASYTHDHQMSRLTQVDSVDVNNKTITVGGKTTAIPTSGRYNYVVVKEQDNNGNWIHGDGKDYATCYHFVDGKVWNHADAGTETVDGVEGVLKEDKQLVYREFKQLFTGYGWGVTSKGLNEYDGVEIHIEEVDQNTSMLKFNCAFPDTSVDENGVVQTNFLYRVGNLNEIKISSLFAAIDGAEINDSGVYVRIDKLYDDADVICTFTPTTTGEWGDGTVKFSGTGVVDIVIQDYDYCEPTVLHLEVVDAWNTTSAISAPYTKDDVKYDVVLLNNVDNAGTITVSDGYTFYGNGFALNYTGDGSYGSAALSYGFVTVKTGGTLDNVRVQCKVFPKSYLYTSEMTAGADGRYPYGNSAIVVSGNSTISNCYAYGARNNIAVGPGNVVITNTVTECGSLANIQVNSAGGYTVTLDDVTTIQYQTTSPFDATAKVLGFGVVVGQPDSASNPTIKLTGNFVQHNWVTEADTSVSNSYAQSAIKSALDVTMYQHTNASGATAVNTGIAYLNDVARTIDDQRTNSEIDYEGSNVSISGYTGYVYSIANKTGNPDAEVDGGTSDNADMLPDVIFTGAQSDSVKMTTSFDTVTERWVNTLTLDLDNISGGSYSFSFNDLAVQKYGVDLSYTVKDSDGKAVEKTAPITVNQLYNAEYTLVVVDTQIYDKNGKLTGETVTRELPFILYATKTSIDPPKFTDLGSGGAIKTHEISGIEDNWRPAYEALTGVTVTYWSATNGVTTVKLDTLTNNGTISGATWTYTCNDYTLTITGGQVHTDGSTISPIVVNNTLYFWSANKAFGTGTTSRDIRLTYTFTDKNASTTESLTKSVSFDNLTYYKKSDFANGTLTKGKESTGCVTAGTMITMADGTQKAIEELNIGDMVLAFNHESGEFVATPVIFNTHVDDLEPREYDVLHLEFSNGEELEIVESHGLFDMTLLKYVYLDYENYTDFIGHKFFYTGADGTSAEHITLENGYIATEVTRIFCPVTYFNMNSIANGFLNAPNSPYGIAGPVNYFDYDSDLKYNEEKMRADIEKYGLYTYEDFKDYISEEAFNSSTAIYLKIAEAKGLITFEEILIVINYLLEGSLIDN